MVEYKIIKIEPQKRHKNRYNIFTVDGFLLSLSDETLVKNHIEEGMTVDGELLTQLRKEDTFQFAKLLAANYLSYAPRSKKQLEQHLQRHNIDVESIRDTISLMESYGYIHDEGLAEEYAKSYSKKYGTKVMVDKMVSKGLPLALAKEKATKYAGLQKDTIRELFEKLCEKYKGEAVVKKKQKIYAALTRKGFSYDEIGPLLTSIGEDEGYYDG